MRAWGRGGGGGGRRERPTPYSRGGGGGESDDCTVFVGNLAFETTWQELKDHFKSAGQVERADVMERPDGTSKGIGLVKFSSPDEAAAAIEQLNETDLGGREIFVRADKGGGGAKGAKGDRGGSKGAGKGKGGGRGKGGGAPKSMSELDDDLDSYMGGGGGGGDDGGEETGGGGNKGRKGGKGGKGGPPKSAEDLDGDLDSYFAKKADKEAGAEA